MVSASEQGKSRGEGITIPNKELEALIKRFGKFREANSAAYLATTNEQFTNRISDDIADQRLYLEHQIMYSDVRVKAFSGDSVKQLPADLSVLSRDDLIRLFDDQTQQLSEIFSNQNNLTKSVSIPYAGTVTGMTALFNMIIHEAAHLGLNEGTLGHFGITRSEEVTKPLGR